MILRWPGAYFWTSRDQFGHLETNRPSEDIPCPTTGTGRAEVEDTIVLADADGRMSADHDRTPIGKPQVEGASKECCDSVLRRRSEGNTTALSGTKRGLLTLTDKRDGGGSRRSGAPGIYRSSSSCLLKTMHPVREDRAHGFRILLLCRILGYRSSAHA